MKHLLVLKDKKRLLDTPSYYAVELVQDPDGPCMVDATTEDMHALGLRLPDDPTAFVMEPVEGRKPVKRALVTVDKPPTVWRLTPQSLSFALAVVLTDAEPLNEKDEPERVWTRAAAAKLIPAGKQAEVFEAVASMLTAAIAGEDLPGEGEEPERPTSAATGDEKP